MSHIVNEYSWRCSRCNENIITKKVCIARSPRLTLLRGGLYLTAALVASCGRPEINPTPLAPSASTWTSSPSIPTIVPPPLSNSGSSSSNSKNNNKGKKGVHGHELD